MICSWFLVSTQKLVEFLEAWKINFESWSKGRSFCTEPARKVTLSSARSAPLTRTVHERLMPACRLRREAVPCILIGPTCAPPPPAPPPLPVASLPHRTPISSPFSSPYQAMEEELTPSHQIHPTLAGDRRRTREGRRRRAPPPPRPPLPRRRPRRRTSPSFFFFFPKPSRMNSTRSTTMSLYSNKWLLARAILVTGELPSLFTFLSLPLTKLPSPFISFSPLMT